VLVPAVRPGLYDHVFIAADRFLFGTDPTAALHRIAHPVLTEFLQISYASFYLLPILLSAALLRRKRYAALDYAVFCVIYGFFLSYLGYFILPAVGPRFSLHDFYSINTDLPGLLLTNPIRDFVNLGASASSTHPNAAGIIQRDVFPSGHTLVTLVTLYSAFRLRTRMRYVLFPVGILLIFSTVYLRYHYVTDVIGGFVFFLLTMTTGKLVYDAWRKRRGLPPFRWEEA
jgi:membrane-associated phospholipid phosphatase